MQDKGNGLESALLKGILEITFFLSLAHTNIPSHTLEFIADS